MAAKLREIMLPVGVSHRMGQNKQLLTGNCPKGDPKSLSHKQALEEVDFVIARRYEWETGMS